MQAHRVEENENLKIEGRGQKTNLL